ncbi:hypothetical protein [Rhabdothermincola sediminis]|uniref:hypothetical protein n=1 Tax=Rhabdothermincola sediminis TaxID=2751370 RepID=UPI001AA0A91E|nr:hypothetical protein [Rhabdothermincola sediminis]
MIAVFVVIAVIVVVAIALVAVGTVTGRLAGEPPTSVFHLDEAVHYVADRLQEDLTARLSYDDVRAVIGWHLDYLQAKGVAGVSDHDLAAAPAGPIVTADDEAVAYVLGRAEGSGLELDDVDVVEVLEAEVAYLRAIGAIGPEVPGGVDPGS